MIEAALAVLGIVGFAMLQKKKPTEPTPPSGGGGGGGNGGPTIPTDTPGTGGGGGAGSPPGNPPPPVPVAPLPKVGTVYRPNKYTSETTAYPFKGRSVVEGWNANEDKGSSPLQRHAHIMAALDAHQIDPPRWVRIPVRDGLEVEVTGDVVSLQGLRLCGPMASAQAIADRWGAMLITPGISDAIWKAATVKIAPQTTGWFDRPGHWINPGGGVPWLLYEADRVQAQLEQGPVGEPVRTGDDKYLIDTLGKDYVLEARTSEPGHKDKCCIYGWHLLNGTPFQSPESGGSFIHELTYFDYSHAIRLVRTVCWLNGKADNLARIYRERPKLVSYLARPSGPIPARHPGLPLVSGGGVPL